MTSVCATSIIRTTTLASSSRSKDTSWGYIPATIWSVVEANTGTICACLPMLRQPLAQLFPKIFGSSKGSSLGKSPREYALAAKGNSGRPSYSLKNRGNSTDYHQWAMSDRTIVSSKKNGRPSRRESEERIIGRDQVGSIMRTTDVNVAYHAGDSESLPSLKNEIYTG